MPLNVIFIVVMRMSSFSQRRRVGIPHLLKIAEKHVLTDDPHRANPNGLATAISARYQHWRPRNHIPLNDDLPRILSTTGMVKLCNRPENQSSPLIGLDVAPTNFGIAISDETRTFALPVTRILRRDSTKKLDPSVVLRKLKKIIDDSDACALVVGWPLSKSGLAESQCLMVLQFLRQLHLKGKVDIPVTLWDERLTSVEARDILRDDYIGRRMADEEDEISAMVILQGFLDSAEPDRDGLST